MPTAPSTECGGSGSAITAGRYGRKMPDFLAADGFAIRAEVIDVIDADAGQDRAIGIHHVHRVEPSTEADLEDQRFQVGPGKSMQRCERAELEIGQRHAVARLPRPPRSPAQSASSLASAPAMRTRSL